MKDSLLKRVKEIWREEKILVIVFLFGILMYTFFEGFILIENILALIIFIGFIFTVGQLSKVKNIPRWAMVIIVVSLFMFLGFLVSLVDKINNEENMGEDSGYCEYHICRP